MGSACCVAAKERHVTRRTSHGAPHRNVTCSPSWSFRWENRRRVADEVGDSPYHTSQRESRNISVEIKTSLGSERTFSDGGSPFENFGTPNSQKSPLHQGVVLNTLIPLPYDSSLASNCSREVKSLAESPNLASSTVPKLSFSLPSVSAPVSEVSTHAPPLPPKSTPSRRARRSPGHQLFRQVSDSRILGLKSPDNNSLSEGRSSFVLSSCSNDFAIRSHGGSSDGWSMHTFSELVASSQRERWSFDSEHLGLGMNKINGSSGRFSCSPSEENQTCGACSKLLKERSSWSNYDLPVVSVLFCGHVYHAECLEVMTLETDRYDPTCPICMVGEKRVSKMSKRALKAEAELKAKLYKKSKNRVVDSNLDGGCDDFVYQKDAAREGKALKMDPGSGLRSTLAKPFLKRHFSLGSKSSKPLVRDSAALKKGFWSRYRKD